MKRYLSALFLIILSTHTAWSQDDTSARESYLLAEQAYLEARWSESLSHLRKAEDLLGRKTPRIQFLKVLVYEKLALENIEALDPALAETRSYLQMQNELPLLHQKYLAIARQIEKELPGKAKANHEARIQAKLLAEKIAWQEESAKRRIGFSIALPGTDWMGTELAVILGSRARMWMIGISTTIGKEIVLDDEWNIKIAGKLDGKPDGYILNNPHFHIAYLQGIRVLPRERDFIKPFVGVKGILHHEYTRTYHTDNKNGVQPTSETLANIRKYKLDPADFFTVKSKASTAVSADILVGAMLHIKSSTLFVGMDVMNSKRLQFGAAFKITK